MRGFRIEQKKMIRTFWWRLNWTRWNRNSFHVQTSCHTFHWGLLPPKWLFHSQQGFRANFQGHSAKLLEWLCQWWLVTCWPLIGHDRSWQKVNDQLWAKAADKNFHFHCVNFGVTMWISVEANHQQRQTTSDRSWLMSGQQVTDRHQQKKCFDDTFQHSGPVSQFSTTMRLEHASLPIVSCASGSWLRTVATVSLWTQNLISCSADTAG